MAPTLTTAIFPKSVVGPLPPILTATQGQCCVPEDRNTNYTDLEITFLRKALQLLLESNDGLVKDKAVFIFSSKIKDVVYKNSEKR